MSFTALDPKTALVVIDLQNGIVALPTAHPVERVVRNAVKLIDAFRVRGLPVVLVNVAGIPPGRTEQARRSGELSADWIALIPELGRQPGDHLVTKHSPGAFSRTDLETRLRSLGVTQVVVVGVSTSQGVEVTARQAFELGFHVSLPTDAMTDLQADAHDWSTTRVFPRIAETGTTDEMLALIERSL